MQKISGVKKKVVKNFSEKQKKRRSQMSLKNIQKGTRFLKSDQAQRYTLGIVYEPGVVDSQDDYSDEMEIEKACWGFTKFIQGEKKLTKAALNFVESIIKAQNGEGDQMVDITELTEALKKMTHPVGYEHVYWDEGLGEVVENYITRADMTINGQFIKKGTWLLGVQWSQAQWANVQAGLINGYSMGGEGIRIEGV